MSATSGRTPLDNPYLQTDMDSNQLYVANLEGLKMSATHKQSVGSLKELWLSVRSDGVTGTGTELDPLNCGGATPAIAAATYANILHTFRPNYTFRYKPGLYYTLGYSFGIRATAGAGCKHYFPGAELAEVRLYGSTASPSTGVLFKAIDDATRVDGFEVWDVTLNCDASNQPDWTNPLTHQGSGALYVRGSNIALRRSNVIGFGTNQVGIECFPVIIGSANDGGDYSNNLVEDCYATTNLASVDGISVITVGPVAIGTTGTNNQINNTVVDMTGVTATYTHAFFAQQINNSIAKGCTGGFYSEPPNQSTSAITVRNSEFYSCTAGVLSVAHVAAALTKGISIENSKFIDCGNVINVSGDDAGTYFDVIKITGCEFTTSAGTVSTNRAAQISGANSAIIQNNLFDTSHASAINLGVVSATIENNRKKDNTLITTALNGSPYSGDIARLSVAKNIFTGQVGVGGQDPSAVLAIKGSGTILQLKNSSASRYRGDVNLASDGTFQILSYDDTGVVYRPITIDGLSIALNASNGGTFAVGGGLAMTKIVSATASLDFPSMATLTEATLTITVTGAVTTNTPTVLLGWASVLPTGIVVKQAWVSASNVVSIRVANYSSGTLDPTSQTVRATVIQS